MLASQSREKNYADPKCGNVEFQVGDHVFLRVSPMHGVRRFGKKGKLNSKFVGPFEIAERIGQVAYMLALPPTLEGVLITLRFRVILMSLSLMFISN